MSKNTPPGGDRRFNYVSYSGLWPEDQTAVLAFYYHPTAYLPAQEYMYPIDKTGRFARARRWISQERSQELYDLYQVEQVMES